MILKKNVYKNESLINLLGSLDIIMEINLKEPDGEHYYLTKSIILFEMPKRK